MRCLVLLAMLFAWLGPAFAAEPALILRFGDETRRLTTAELLARPDVQSVTTGDQDAYKRPMTYRAVPLLALLPADERFDTLEVRATDGFAAQLPMVLLRNAMRGGAVPWLAIEPPGHPWPILPGKNMTAAPFSIV